MCASRRASTTRSASFPEFIDGYGILILPTTGRYLHVPYRALVPAGRRQSAGGRRCIGGDKVSHASARNMMCCAVSGQGAGSPPPSRCSATRRSTGSMSAPCRKELARQGVRFR